MVLKFYNTLTRKKETFKPINKDVVGIYSCGPTVYWYQHIGNMRTYVFSDILKRTLIFNGYSVRHIINVTDVGHLTSDADEGEDKMEKAAKKEGKSAGEIAEFYFNALKNDLEKLNIIFPEKFPRASEHIKEQIEIIKKLEKKGLTYETEDGIYFNAAKSKNYGKLARLKKINILAGKRISLGEKINPTDFALWKFSSSSDGKRQQEWNSPWGVGFPGWHIECSAMSMKYLGEHFDIHTGGMDHIPIHHTNEIAQSENATGKKFVNYWMHGAFLTHEGEKISKSKGGLYTISQLEEQKFPALSFRYLCLTTHYRKPLDFSLKNLESAKNSYERLRKLTLKIRNDFVHNINYDSNLNKEYLARFEEEINDDLNIPNALQVLWDFVRDEKSKGKYKTIEKMDKVLGLNLLYLEKDKKIEKLIEKRKKAREKHDWKTADRLRDQIYNLGFKVDDAKEGSFISGTGPPKI